LPEFRVANIVRDRELLELAKQEASRFASTAEATITEIERTRVWARLKEAWQRRYGLVEAG
jgi:ATP-dependent DNA helicase RecG